MRSVVLIAFAVLGLSACSSQSEQTGGGVYDMKAVQEYNARVTSGNTVTQAQKDKVASQVDTNLKLNASDNKVKTRITIILDRKNKALIIQQSPKGWTVKSRLSYGNHRATSLSLN